MGKIEAKLFRVRPLEVVPDSKDYQYDLAIISSILRPPKEQILWYWQYLMESFGETTNRVQIVLADNTSNHDSRQVLEHLGREKPTNITSIFLHEPKPGQIHGLNKCLGEIRSPLVIKVDIDKTPAEGTLPNLFRRIQKDPSLALLSAKSSPNLTGENLAQRSLGLRKEPAIPNWNDGIAYIAQRDFLHGWNHTLIEDCYIYRTVVAQGGTFKVAHDLLVYRRRPVTLAGQARQTARHMVGDLQLDTLTIRDKEGYQWQLAKYRYVSPYPEQPGINRLAQQIRSLPKDQWSEIPAIILSKVLRRYLFMPYYLEEYKRLLQNNPDLCTW
jgi:hypothetical protein